MKELVLLQGDQLDIDFSAIGFDLDKPQYSICPSCAAQTIKLSDGCGVCGWSQDKKLQGDKLLIPFPCPCLIKKPHSEPIEGVIIRANSLGFDVKINDRVVNVPKIYVFPKLPSPKKCRTDRDLSPCKKPRRKRGEGSGYIEYREVKRGAKTYKQAWLNYEIWQDGDRLVKSSKYIPKKLESKILRMNQEKVPVEKILKILNSKSKSKRSKK